ncbi:hypothetical protein Tco_0893506 [Tanacetum coccineum]|uniref:Uncharacterized protein n=1 Tax=Tanacetum coccineum TaxID=301880 RepID=A0ABQ5CAJ5_9ASTR
MYSTRSVDFLNGSHIRELVQSGSPRCQEAIGGSIAQTRIDGFMYNIVQESGELGGRLEANKEGVTFVYCIPSQEDQPLEKEHLGVFMAAKYYADAAKENVTLILETTKAFSTGMEILLQVSDQKSSLGMRDAHPDQKQNLIHEGSKRQKTNEALRSVQEQPEEEEKDLSQEDLQQMMMVVPVEEVCDKALQVKYLIINWEVYTEESRKY